jgi:hypothetical protein
MIHSSQIENNYQAICERYWRSLKRNPRMILSEEVGDEKEL